MIKCLVFLFLSATVAAQLYIPNDVLFDYQDDAQLIYIPEFENYPEVLPDYRAFSYPQRSYSHQMWNGCGCATAKTYGDYMKSRPRFRDQRLFSYYQMM